MVGNQQLLAKAGKSASSVIKEAVVPLLQEQPCLSCAGARINPLARHVTIEQLALHELCQLPIEKAIEFVKDLRLDKQERKLLDEVHTQLIHPSLLFERSGAALFIP